MAGLELAFSSLGTLLEAIEPEQLCREQSREIVRLFRNIKCQQRKAKFLKFLQILVKKNTNCFCFLTVPPFLVSVIGRKRGRRVIPKETRKEKETRSAITCLRFLEASFCLALDCLPSFALSLRQMASCHKHHHALRSSDHNVTLQLS